MPLLRGSSGFFFIYKEFSWKVKKDFHNELENANIATVRTIENEYRYY
jgi:hypothetical protein